MTRRSPEGAFGSKDGVPRMLKCRYCHRKFGKCKMDKQGLCTKHPQSDGKAKRRTKAEKERDEKLGY